MEPGRGPQTSKDLVGDTGDVNRANMERSEGFFVKYAGRGLVEAEHPEVAVLRVRPGDIIVLRFPRVLSDEEHEHILKQAQATWPDNQVVVLENGVELLLVRKDEG